MEFRPFGQELDGERIQDVSGMTVRANLEYLKDLVTRSRGREAGDSVIGELVDLLNARIPDPAFHVTSEFLKNPWNSYSYEFVMFLNEFCAILSGDDLFCFHLGREKFLSPVIQLLGRPLSIVQIYKLYPHFVEKFTKGALVPEVMSVTNGMAVMRLRFSDRTKRQFGPYLRSCADRICQTTKATIAEVPARMFGLQPAIIQDNSCIGEGADFCEWTFTWQPQESRFLLWLGVGSILGLVVLALFQTWSPQYPLWLQVGLACVPGLIFWLTGRLWADRQEIQAQGKIIQEQLEAAEDRHEELREAYVAQEQILVELRKRIGELTMIHQTGLTIGSTLDRDHLIQAGLEAIISALPYDRAMLTHYDSQKHLAYGARIVGVSTEISDYANSMEVPINDESIEGTVFEKGEPLVIEETTETFSRFHPFYQQLMQDLHTKAFVAVPLRVQNRIIGALVGDRLESNAFSTQDVTLLATVANQLAIALEHANAYAEIEQLNVGLEAKVKERTAELEDLNHVLEKTNERLREVDCLKSAFLSHCSHELRTPLTSIKGFIDNLLQRIGGESLSERQELYLRRVQSNADRLTRMIADLLDLSRIESQTLRMTWGTVRLPQLIQDVMAQLQFLTKEKSQQMEMISSETELTLVGDCDRIHQILTNLIHNAIKFTPENGEIRIEVGAESDEFVRVGVSDTGCGIPVDAQAKLFDPFFQAHGGYDGDIKGLGLGLAIVKSLVDLHGGEITFQSEVGKGTSFHVRLPKQRAI